jgi:hypothetical protein
MDDREGVDMSERTAEQATGPQPDVAADRKRWTELRTDAYNGQLWPEGFKLVDELHDLHPEWRAQW